MQPADSVAKYWHTLRHLRPAQLYGRLWFRLYRPRPDQRTAPERRPSDGNWAAPARRAALMSGPETFRFLNETHRVVGPAGWNDPDRDKLWLYNLHYFDDLNATDAAARADWHRALLVRWVAENPPGAGNGWEPYPTSLRIVNWIKWALAGNALPPECVQSLAVQTRWLRRRLEHHLLGNHLFANAKALLFAGAFFVGPEAGRWLAAGRRLVARELHEQILPDGGHFERSPMYHAILLEDVLDLINLAGIYPETLEPAAVAFCRDRAEAMTYWLHAMCHPDGEIGFFNDAAFGIAPTLAQLTDYRRRLGLSPSCHPPASILSPASALTYTDPPARIRSHASARERLRDAPHPDPELEVGGSRTIWLRESGYVRLQAASAVALLDVAPIGPDYLPGHAHADTLSFELSLFGQRVIVNGGTSRYGLGPERLAERGTAAHSTVQIDGADSSEVWGGFRVARRARPFDVRLEEGLKVSAAHDGYLRLPGRPIHRRNWELNNCRLVVTDRIEGRVDEAIARFHLHPDVKAEGEGGQGHLQLRCGHRVRWQVSGGEAQIIGDHWSPQFGLRLSSRCLAIMLRGEVCRLELDWSDIA